jgi:hypothetical protein
MSESSGKSRSRPLLFAAGFYVAVGLYLIAFSLSSSTDLLSLIVLAVASILGGTGLYMLKRWGFWLAIAVFPLLATVAVSTLSFSIGIPSESIGAGAILFDVSLGIVLILSFVSVLIVLDSRSSFKKGSSEPPPSKPDRS